MVTRRMLFGGGAAVIAGATAVALNEGEQRRSQSAPLCRLRPAKVGEMALGGGVYSPATPMRAYVLEVYNPVTRSYESVQ